MASELPYSLQAKVQSVEPNNAVLILENGQTISWPRYALPKDVKEGAIVQIVLRTNEEAKNEHKKIAESILNEIFNG